MFPDTTMKYGGSLVGSRVATPDDSPLPAVAGPSTEATHAIYHPGSALFWFGVLAAGAVGLAFASTTVRVGPAKVSASIGKS